MADFQIDITIEQSYWEIVFDPDATLSWAVNCAADQISGGASAGTCQIDGYHFGNWSRRDL